MPNSSTNERDNAFDLPTQARACQICTDLPLGPRPLFQVAQSSRILIVGQAPGRKTHEKGIPFDDPSGDRLRDWMGVSRDTFYDPKKIGVLPMGFCFPGTGKTGDLPPRPECEQAWRRQFMDWIRDIRLTIIIGKYARDWHLPDRASENVTETVADWKSLLPAAIALPHPSPRNNRWLKKNPWFAEDTLPALKSIVSDILSDTS